MKQEKLETISNLFQGNEIRSIWNSEEEEYYFSVIDVVDVLIESNNPSKYWDKLKKELMDNGSLLCESIVQFKMKSEEDGKLQLTDTLDIKGILRLIQEIPDKKAEPYKMWFANLGKERFDEVFDPEVAIDRAINYYRKKGYTYDWIEAKLVKTIYNS